MHVIDGLEHHAGLGCIKQGSKAVIEYCLEYTHNGSTWGMTFFAENDEDAEKKAESMRSSLSLLGRLDERIQGEAERGHSERSHLAYHPDSLGV